MILKQRLKAVAVFVGLWLRNAVIFFFVSTLLAVVRGGWVPVSLTPLMLTRAVGHVMDGHLPRLHHKWVSLDEIHDTAGQAVIAREDQNC